MSHGVKPIDVGIDIGQVFLGKYRVDAIIGQGGMGVVAECTHLALNERVAIKMLRQDVLLDQDAVQRFVREAQAAVKLKSEYVARVSDVGTFENNVPYMVMEFLEGHDLGALLKQRGVLPVAWATELILQTCEALAEAHSLGIVHRDVKPTNLFVTWRPDGSALVKVLDFGISKSPMGTDMQLTQTQSLLGTPAYMSPEQMRSARQVDSRTDIWSLGTVFYEILEGRRPFEAESFSEMCVKVAVDAPAPMMNTPPALQQVILRCLAKQPEQRYATMADLGRDLIPFVADGHQGQMLVERMTRMLRRGHHWDADGSGTRTPRGSDPAAAQWQAPSEPFASPLRATPVPGHPITNLPYPRAQTDAAYHAGYASVPHTISEPPRRQRWPLIVALFTILIGAGIALGIVLSSSSPDEVAAPVVKEPTKVDPNAANTANTANPTKGVGSAAVATPIPGSAAVGAARGSGTSDEHAIGSAEVPAAGSAVAKSIADGSAASHPIKKPGGGHTKLIRVGPTTKSDNPTAKPEGAGSAAPPPPPAAKCDPFSAMHSCDKKPTGAMLEKP